MGLEFQPVQSFPLDKKIAQTLSVDVDAMLCDSQARGIKRKYDEDKDRETRSSLYFNQRQTVFNISLCKRNRFRQTLSLRRSVLICNTLRRIQKEFEQEGVKINYAPNRHFFLSPLNQQVLTLDPPPLPSQTTLERCPQELLRNNFNHEVEKKVTQRCLSFTALPQTDLVDNYSVMSTVLSAYQYKPPPQIKELSNKLQASSLLNTCLPKTCTITKGEVMKRQICNETTEECDRCLTEFDTSSGRITPFVKTACDSSAFWNDDGDRLTSLNWSSVLNCSSSSISAASSAMAMGEGYDDNCRFIDRAAVENADTSSKSSPGVSETSLHVLLPATSELSTLSAMNKAYAASSSCSPSSGSTSSCSSGDEIFGDIDMSLYDFDLYSPLSPPNVKLAPVSAEELMKSLTENGQSCPVSNWTKEKMNEEGDSATLAVS
ncbi:uncharacterized protein LOC143254934 [Tachypleus tridentatus]|uniref:uncharacterized protein LOC143254934 n=1 Tax=Tachypleus tridentatus TaxID=6853 RepID=UPI003FD1FC7E